MCSDIVGHLLVLVPPSHAVLVPLHAQVGSQPSTRLTAPEAGSATPSMWLGATSAAGSGFLPVAALNAAVSAHLAIVVVLVVGLLLGEFRVHSLSPIRPGTICKRTPSKAVSRCHGCAVLLLCCAQSADQGLNVTMLIQ
jgi:hypothetical protein